MIATFSGKLGDFVYALPVFKAVGIRHLELVVDQWDWDAGGAARLALTQEYISSANAVNQSVKRIQKPSFPFDTWRRNYNNNLNLTDMMCKWLGVDYPARREPWLKIGSPPIDTMVVVSRSKTYHNDRFPWKEVIQAIHDAGKVPWFVGYQDEFRDLTRVIASPQMSYLETPSLLQLASLVNSCHAVVANQSAVRAIAEGLKKPILVEQCPDCPNTHWERPDAHYWTHPGDRIPEELFR